MASANSNAQWFVVLILSKLPFLNAITLLMLLSERAKRETYPPIEPKLIYIYIGLFIACSVCMSSNILRKQTALVTAGQMAFFAFSMYSNPKLGYSEEVRIRMSHHQAGSICVYVLLAYYWDTNKSPFLKKLYEILFGIYLFCMAYILNSIQKDRDAFHALVPKADYIMYSVILIFVFSAICLFSSYYSSKILVILIVTLSLMTFLVEGSVSYWMAKHGMDQWIQYRLILDNITVVLGLILLLLIFGNTSVKKSPGAGKESNKTPVAKNGNKTPVAKEGNKTPGAKEGKKSR